VQVNSAEPHTQADGPSVRIPVDVRRFPWIRRLAADYAFDFESVAPFFSGDPANRSAWTDAIARTQAHDRRRDEIAAVIAAQQDHRQAPPAARDAARLLADRRTVAIVTGQQAGLFGGPLFTLLKALTALKLAEQVSRDHKIPAIAIFWIDAEDHDWEEVRSCTVFAAHTAYYRFDGRGYCKILRATARAPSPTAIASTPAAASGSRSRSAPTRWTPSFGSPAPTAARTSATTPGSTGALRPTAG